MEDQERKLYKVENNFIMLKLKVNEGSKGLLDNRTYEIVFLWKEPLKAKTKSFKVFEKMRKRIKNMRKQT